jgi:Flp pilus assembly protein TadG
MTACWAARARLGRASGGRCGVGGGERGSVTVFVAIVAVGLLAMAGLVVDGGAKVRAIQRADRVAAEAARAAGQSVDVSRALRGDGIRVDRRAARAAAEQYLRASGALGEARVSQDGRAITVTTHASAPTVFLGLIGVPALSVTGHAEVSLVHFEGGVLR